jgi:hypothetical protein
MKKFLTGAMAAVTLAGSLAATSAQAEPYRYRRDNDNDTAAAAIVGGVVGLALGAAIAGSNKDRGRYYDNGYYDNRYYGRSYYNQGYYDRGYYDRRYARPYAYGYGYAPRVCTSRERVYDPYIGRRVTVQRRYAC